MKTHLKAENLWTIVANSFEVPENNDELTAAEMKIVETKYRQNAKALNKIQMEVSRAYFAKLLLVRLQRKFGIVLCNNPQNELG